MTEAEHRGGRRSTPAFQFRLRSHFLAMAVCAVLLGLYIGYGLFGVLVVAVIALAALIWVSVLIYTDKLMVPRDKFSKCDSVDSVIAAAKKLTERKKN